MCCSALTQIVYGGLILVAFVLNGFSMFTKGLISVADNFENQIKNLTNNPNQIGNLDLGQFKALIPLVCIAPGSRTDGQLTCSEWWQKQPEWMQAVIILTALAFIAQFILFIWNFITFCACCCKRYIIAPLAPVTALTAIILTVAIVIFGINNKDYIKEITNVQEINPNDDVNYSFYLGIGSIVLTVAAFIAASVATWFAHKSL